MLVWIPPTLPKFPNHPPSPDTFLYPQSIFPSPLVASKSCSRRQAHSPARQTGLRLAVLEWWGRSGFFFFLSLVWGVFFFWVGGGGRVGGGDDDDDEDAGHVGGACEGWVVQVGAGQSVFVGGGVRRDGPLPLWEEEVDARALPDR